MTKELDLDQSVDTLGRWMAHYVAELILEAEKAGVEERPAKMRACSEAILSLWKHRHELPNGKRPFEELEPILRALESLDPDDDMPRYFRPLRPEAQSAGDEAKPWLELVDGLDLTAKMLIGYCLAQAAKNAIDKTAEWVVLAEAAGLEHEFEFPVIRLVSLEKHVPGSLQPSQAEAQRIEDRLKRLDAFTAMATLLATELRQRLEALPERKDGS